MLFVVVHGTMFAMILESRRPAAAVSAYVRGHNHNRIINSVAASPRRGRRSARVHLISDTTPQRRQRRRRRDDTQTYTLHTEAQVQVHSSSRTSSVYDSSYDSRHSYAYMCMFMCVCVSVHVHRPAAVSSDERMPGTSK